MTASTDSGTKSSTGSEVLDDALRGGFPERRTVLVTGGPGTGKTTLAMQFLQAGIDAGESGLFVSTEQTAGELRDAFAGFEFDVDHPDLTTTSLHATTGYTLEDDEETLTLQSLEGDESVGDGYSAPFEPQHVTTHLERHGPVDRVVVDSVSGLSAMGDGYDRFRRAVFDLVRLFNDEFGATAVFTAEETGGTRGGERGTDGVRSVAAEDAVQFNTHGVVRLWREAVGGEFHRFLEVTKMRGVDHDTRVYEVDIEPTGLRAYPRMRTHPGEFVPDDYMATGIEGLDDLLGGGVPRGGSVLLEHDGRASPHSILTALMRRAIDEGMSITLVPPVELPPKRLERVLADRVGDMDELLADDRLFLLDFANVWENTRRNVFKPTAHDEEDTLETFRTADERRGDRSMLSLLNVEAQLPVLGTDQLRRVRFWEEENFYREGDTSVYFFNPDTMTDRVGAFYRNAAWQVIRTWLSDKGLQYIKLEKSPAGFLGSSRLVEYVEEPPFMHVQRPPHPAEGSNGNGTGSDRGDRSDDGTDRAGSGEGR